MEPARLSVIAGQLGNVSTRLQALAMALSQPESAPAAQVALSGVPAQLQDLIGLLRHEERLRLEETRRLDEILDVLFGLAGLDFSKRASVGEEGNVLDAVAAAANMLSEEVEAAQNALAERNRALEGATAAKSQFMANMSHEIRTPLSALMGFADLLLDLKLSESDRINYALIIRRNGEHLLSLINDILDLSKIEAGKLTLELLACSLSQILSDVESLMQGRAAEAGLGFGIEFMTPVPEQFFSDPTRLRQILMNLVGNAIKFTQSGSVRLVVSYYGDPPFLNFAVVDTGIGMSDEQVGRLFRPFEQADPSMTRRFGGTGLGLAICQPLAQALGGSLGVRSTPGKGSTFTLKIAVELPEYSSWIDRLEANQTLTAAGPSLKPESLAGMVLLAEDGPDNQLYISTVLRRCGLVVVLAENGQIAIDRALSAWHAGKPYDVILMDMQMPEVDGYSATIQLRELGYTGTIIALTAHAMAGERERCIAAGCDDFLTKPITRQHLVDQVARHLPQRPERQRPSSQRAVKAEEAAASEPSGAPLYSTYSDDADMAELISRFVGSMAGKISELRSAGSLPDLPLLNRLAHQLKGAAGGYGFSSVSQAAGWLEQALLNNAPYESRLDALIQICQRVKVKGKPSD